jgi:hypothetical protein
MAKTKKAVKTKKPLFDRIIFSGVARIEKRGTKKALVIYTSRKDAMKSGVPEEIAKQLFPNVIAGPGDCKENWSFAGDTMKCDDTGCTLTCTVQVNKLDGKGWGDLTTGTAIIVPAWAYRCACVP